MSKKSKENITEQIKTTETEVIQKIPQLFLCCFCSQMVNYQLFIFHYAHCKDIFIQEDDGIDGSIRDNIKLLDQLCSSIYHSIKSEKNSLIDILEMNKTAKEIHKQLVSLTQVCPKCGARINFVKQQSHYSKCGYDSQDCSESSMTTSNCSIQLNSDMPKRKRIKDVSLRLKEFVIEEMKDLTTSFSIVI